MGISPVQAILADIVDCILTIDSIRERAANARSLAPALDRIGEPEKSGVVPAGQWRDEGAALEFIRANPDIRMSHRGAAEDAYLSGQWGDNARILVSTALGFAQRLLARAMKIGNFHRLMDWNQRNS